MNIKTLWTMNASSDFYSNLVTIKLHSVGKSKLRRFLIPALMLLCAGVLNSQNSYAHFSEQPISIDGWISSQCHLGESNCYSRMQLTDGAGGDLTAIAEGEMEGFHNQDFNHPSWGTGLLNTYSCNAGTEYLNTLWTATGTGLIGYRHTCDIVTTLGVERDFFTHEADVERTANCPVGHISSLAGDLCEIDVFNNERPEIGNQIAPSRAFINSTRYEYDPMAIDLDRHPNTFLTYTLVGPSWLLVNSATGLVFGRPNITDAGRSFDFELIVSDGLTQHDATVTRSFTVNSRPVANVGGPYTGIINQSVQFSGSGTDPDGDNIVSYTWNFGAGTGTGQSPAHTFSTIGVHQVSLIVNDGDIDSFVAQTTVEISGPPIAKAGGPYVANLGKRIAFDGTQSYDPANTGTLTYAWDFGDGQTSTNAQPTHIYETLPAGPATLTVNNGIMDSDPVTVALVVIDPLAPTGFNIDLNKGALNTCNGSNPINGATGNKYQRETDYVGAGPLPIVFERHYNSQSSNTLTMGYGWRHTYDRRVVVNTTVAPNTAKVYRADGIVYEYELSGGNWVSISSTTTAKLIANGPGWTLVTNTNISENYDSNGLLTSTTNIAGQSLSFTYLNGKLDSVSDQFGRTISLSYNAQGQLGALTDPAQNIISYSYDALGNLESVTYPIETNAASQIVTYVYDDPNFDHLLTGIIDEKSVRYATFNYDSQGRAILSTHATGANETVFDYSASTATNTATIITDSQGQNRTYNYTNASGVLKIGNIDGPQCTVCGGGGAINTYDNNGFLDLATDFNGVTTNYDFDARGLQIRKVEAEGTVDERTTSTTWHAIYRLPECVVEPTRTIDFSYYPNGLLESRREIDTTNATLFPNPASKECEAISAMTQQLNDRTWRYTYYGPTDGRIAGMLHTIDGPREDVSDVTTYIYDEPTGNLREIRRPLGLTSTITTNDEHGRMTEFVDPNGLVTLYIYDRRGLLRFIKKGSVASGFQVKEITRYPNGKIDIIHLPDGGFLNYDYDDAQRLTDIFDQLGNHIRYGLDNLGNVTLEEVIDGQGTLNSTLTRVYDSENHLDYEQGAATPPQVIDYVLYDGNGNLIDLDDPLLRRTHFEYDKLNRLSTLTDPKNGITRYTYRSDGLVESVTDPGDVITIYEYDGLENITKVISQDGGTTEFTEFDPAGNVITILDPRNKTTKYVYDALNRIDLITLEDTSTVDYVYDEGGAASSALGRLTSVHDDSGSYRYTYDLYGRVTNLIQTVDSVALSLDFVFDTANLDRLEQINYPSGAQVQLNYTNAKVSSIDVVGRGPLVTNMQYKPFGPLASWQLASNSNNVIQTYNLDGWMETYSLSGATKTILYYPTGNIESITDSANIASNMSVQYDALNRITHYQGLLGVRAYEYDGGSAGNGNRTALTLGNNAPESYTYYPNTNRLRSIGTGGDIAYDAAGNITNDGQFIYIYNDRNLLTGVTDLANNSVANYKVNYLSARVSKTVFRAVGPVGGDADNNGLFEQNDLLEAANAILNVGKPVGNPNCNGDEYLNTQDLTCISRAISEGKTILFLYNSEGQLLGEYNQFGSAIREYVWIDGKPLAIITKNGLYYIYSDHLGTPREIVDENGTVVWQWESDPFGVGLANEDPDGNGIDFTADLRFAGQYFDAETGLHYNWNRYYSPETGRYITSDPIGLAGGLNTYSYVYNNPTNWIDPWGLESTAVNPPIDWEVPDWLSSIGVGLRLTLIGITSVLSGDTPQTDNDVLIRRGQNWESTTRLAKQCEAADNAGTASNGIPFGYGVSVTTSMQSNINLANRFGRDPNDFSTGIRSAFTDAGFDVRDTPVKNDKYHKTVVFPKPVTPKMAATFNQLLGRTRK